MTVLEDQTNFKEVFIHDTAVVDLPCTIGVGTKVWHFAHVMQHSTIGQCCILGQNVVVSPYVHLGNGVKVQNNVSIYTGVQCEDEVFLGPSMVFTNVINPRSFVERKHEFRPTLVKRGASIGANATILCGITIGRFAMIGAGAVVTKSVADFALVVGNPARQIGWISRYGHRLEFSPEGKAHCPETGEAYRLSEGVVHDENLDKEN